MGSQAPNNDHVLCELALQCRQSFRNIGQLPHEDEAITSRLEAVFAQPSDSKPILTLMDLEDDHEQFRVWTKNLGVFATDQASLDFRLREANDAKGGIVSLLVSLKSELAASLTLLRQDRTYGKAEDDDSSDRMSNSDSSSESDDVEYSSTQLTALELQARLRRVSDIINKLLKLAEVIRASGVGHRSIRAAKYVHFEDGINMTAQFEEQYLPAVLSHKFKLESPLLERFKKAISMRRRCFMYQAKHQKRLAYGNEHEEQGGRMKQLPRTNSSIFEVSVAEDFVPVHKVAASQVISMLSEPTDHSELQTPTRATKYELLPWKQKVQSTIVSASNKSAAAGIEFPPPPRISDRATHFQCPYCCLLVPRRKLVGRYWREHVIADLQPFLCVEPECPTPDLTFESRRDWIEHQKWEHSMEWWCEGDERQHAPMRFMSSEAYVAHLKQSCALHGYDKPIREINTQVETAGRPSLSPFSCCPLCDFLPENMASLTLEAAQDSVDLAHVCQKQLQKHIADEMLAIFMIALPDRTDAHNSLTDTDSDRSADTRSTVLALSDVSLDFKPFENGIVHLEDEETVMVEPHTDYTRPWSVPEIGDSLESWDVVWASPQLWQSVRETYARIGEDEVLGNFAHSMQTVQPAGFHGTSIFGSEDKDFNPPPTPEDDQKDKETIPSLNDMEDLRQKEMRIWDVQNWLEQSHPSSDQLSANEFHKSIAEVDVESVGASLDDLVSDGLSHASNSTTPAPSSISVYPQYHGTANRAILIFNKRAAENADAASKAATEGSTYADSEGPGIVREGEPKQMIRAATSNAAMMQFIRQTSEAGRASSVATWGTKELGADGFEVDVENTSTWRLPSLSSAWSAMPTSIDDKKGGLIFFGRTRSA